VSFVERHVRHAFGSRIFVGKGRITGEEETRDDVASAHGLDESVLR
jgi:hypothetical protein